MPIRLPLALLLALAAAAAPVRSQGARRALAIEDYYRIQSVGSPVLSDDGRTVTYTVATRVEGDNSTRTETWTVATDGSAEPRRLETGGERGPAQGRRSGPVTSPDGKWIAETVDEATPKPERTYASDFEKRHQERFKGVTFDWKDFQRDGQPFPAPDPHALPASRISVRPAGGGEPKVLQTPQLRPSNLAWNTEGTALVFVADPDWRDELKYENPDLWTVTLDGAATRLTNDGYVYSDPAFSPDGKYISYVRDPGTDMIIQRKLNHGGPSDLYIVPVKGGAAINLTAAWDLEPGPTRWSPDSRFVYFIAAIGGESHLFRASAPGGRVEQVTRGPRRLANLTYDRAMTTIAYTASTHDTLPDVWVASIDGTHERRLTNVNKDLAGEIALGKAETLRWASKDGTPIEGWLLSPHGYHPAKGPYPLIVVSHGGPHAATGYAFDFKQQYFAANGYFVLDTNFRSSTGYGEAFKWATWGAWGDRDGEDVVAGIDYVLKKYPIDPRRVGHTGHSYGGFMTNWLITPVSRPVRRRDHRRRHHQLDQRLRHGRHLPHEGDRVLRHALGDRRARPDDPAITPDLCRPGQDADAVRPRRGRPACPLRRRGTDVLRAQAARRPGADDPVCRPAARHFRALERRAPDAQRAGVVGEVPEEEQSRANYQIPTPKLTDAGSDRASPGARHVGAWPGNPARLVEQPPPFGSWELGRWELSREAPVPQPPPLGSWEL